MCRILRRSKLLLLALVLTGVAPGRAQETRDSLWARLLRVQRTNAVRDSLSPPLRRFTAKSQLRYTQAIAVTDSLWDMVQSAPNKVQRDSLRLILIAHRSGIAGGLWSAGSRYSYLSRGRFFSQIKAYGCDSTRAAAIVAEADTTPWQGWEWPPAYRIGDDVCAVLYREGDGPGSSRRISSETGETMIWSDPDVWFRWNGRRWIITLISR